MSDDTTIPTPEVPEETPEADPLAEARAALEAREAELAAKEKSLQKGFNEIAERERAVASRSIPATPEAELDPELEKQLDPYIDRLVAKKYGGALDAAQSAFFVSVEAELERFSEKENVEPEVLNAVIEEYGLRPQDASIASVRDVFRKAAALHRATTFDAEAERQRLREELLKEQAGGTRVDAVRPLRTEVGGAELDEAALEALSPAERYAYLKNAGVKTGY